MDTLSVLALVLFPLALLIVGQLIKWRVGVSEAAVTAAQPAPASERAQAETVAA
jgi:hypothetical protein